MTEAVLVLNAGSSSIKFGVFEWGADHEPAPLCHGVLEDLSDTPRFTARDGHGTILAEHHGADGIASQDLLRRMIDWIEGHLGGDTLIGVGHRIVHGGRDFGAPLLLDRGSIAAIEALAPLAPLHQPRSVAPIRILETLRPGLAQVGCFDTAFHRDLAPPVSRYGLPRALEAEGLRKYGFHGLSYEYIAGRLPDIDLALPAKRTIVAHLGQGASLCAMHNGRSLDTTMGFSALDGLVMGTRCGSLDPGVLLYLMRARGMGVEALEHMLYHEAGLLGVSGISSDMRVLEASDDPHARQAIDLFTFKIAREAAALANTLGGLDLLIFTGGIGEHSPSVRAAVADRLAWLGVAIEPASNDRSEPRIDPRNTPVEVRVMPTNEERVIARHTIGLLHGSRRA